jgi:hypothetical protein
MLNKTKLSLLLALALGAAGAGRAEADHDRDATWVRLGEVGTHVHDAEDYVNVQPGTRIDALQLRAQDSPVALDGIRVHYTDGHDERIEIRRRLRPGEALTIDLPRSRMAVKTLVLDYANRGPYWRARETAHVQVLALIDDSRGRERVRGDRYRDRDRDDDRYDDRDSDGDRYRDRDGRGRTRTVPAQPGDDAPDRIDWRGEIRVRTP